MINRLLSRSLPALVAALGVVVFFSAAVGTGGALVMLVLPVGLVGVAVALFRRPPRVADLMDDGDRWADRGADLVGRPCWASARAAATLAGEPS